jgi:hypothetical protein
METVYRIWRVVEIMTAVTLLYIAFLTYKDERGQIQEVLERAWIFIDDSQKDPSFLRRFIRASAALSLRAVERVFGTRFWSFRFFVPVIMFAYGSTVMTFVIRTHASGFSSVLLAALGLLFLGFLPAIFSGKKWPLVPGFILGFGVPCFAVLGFLFPVFYETEPLVLFALFTSGVGIVLADYAWLVLNKRFLQLATILRSSTVVLVLGLLVSAGVTAVSFLDLFWPDSWRPNGGNDLLLWASIATHRFLDSRLFLGTMSALVFIAMALLLIYKLAAPLLARVVYLLYEYPLVDNRKIVGTIGTGLFLDAFSGSGWVHWIKGVVA